MYLDESAYTLQPLYVSCLFCHGISDLLISEHHLWGAVNRTAIGITATLFKYNKLLSAWTQPDF